MLFLIAACVGEPGVTDTAPPACRPEDWFPDDDGDGYGALVPATTAACSAPPGFTDTAGDCDDEDAAIFPDAPERCALIDEDCDGLADEGEDPSINVWYTDADGDGYGDVNLPPIVACDRPEGTSVSNIDCDDTDPTINPLQQETFCDDGLDENCDGEDAGDECDFSDGAARNAAASLDIEGWIEARSLGDVSGDGFDDLGALSAGQGWVVYGNSAPTLTLDVAVGTDGALIPPLPCTLQADDFATGAVVVGEASVEVYASPIAAGAIPEARWSGTFTEGAELGDWIFPTATACFDWNGDGVGDIAIADGLIDAKLGVHLGPFPAESGLSVSTPYGTFIDGLVTAESAGDLNGDGLDDLIVDPRDTTDFGFWLGGSEGGTAFDQMDGYHGFSEVKGGHDLTGDGYVDLIAQDRGGGSNSYLYPGPFPAGVVAGSHAQVWFSYAGIVQCCAPLGDVNGDGAEDVGSLFSPFDSSAEELRVLYGPFSGTSSLDSPDRRWREREEVDLSLPVAAGDYNGDGEGDVTTLWANGTSTDLLLLLGVE